MKAARKHLACTSGCRRLIREATRQTGTAAACGKEWGQRYRVMPQFCGPEFEPRVV